MMIGHFATLKKRQNFLDIRRNGFSINCNKLVFNIKKNCSESGIFKYGITVSKKIGNAEQFCVLWEKAQHTIILQ